MPNALKVDWELIREMFTAGLPVKEISANTGVQCSTITSRACRAGWKGKAAQARAMVQASKAGLVAVQAEPDSAGEHSRRARSALALVLVRSAEKLGELEIRTPKQAMAVSDEAEAMVRNCKTVFGWSEGSAMPAVRIGVMATTTIHLGPGAQAQVDERPVIDVDPEPDRPEPT